MLVEAFLTLVQVPPNIMLKTRMVREIQCGYPMQGTLTLHILSHLQDVNPVMVRLARLVCHLEQQVVLLVLLVLHIAPLKHRAEALSPYLVKECDRPDGREDGRHQWSVHMRHLQHRHVVRYP